MMFPTAAQGHMPFVPKYEERKKAEQERQRHKSGPSRVSGAKAQTRRNVSSLPVLCENKVYNHTNPKFISLPNNLNRDLNLNNLDLSKSPKDKSSFLNTVKSIKNFFVRKKAKDTNAKKYVDDDSSSDDDEDQETTTQQGVPRKRIRQDSILAQNVMEAIKEERESDMGSSADSLWKSRNNLSSTDSVRS